MREKKHFAHALSLAKSLLDMREQFVYAIRDAAMARSPGAPFDIDALSRHMLEPYVDDALYAIGRDGLARLEDNVRNVIDEAVRAAAERSASVRTTEGRLNPPSSAPR